VAESPFWTVHECFHLADLCNSGSLRGLLDFTGNQRVRSGAISYSFEDQFTPTGIRPQKEV
jgi:hypothetical protein